jgi:rhodanese-related sulfurtransferase
MAANRRTSRLPDDVTRDELVRELAAERPPLLVEALGAAYFADAHLPGALNIPPGQVERLAPQLLPDRTADIVVYCSGSCSSSEMAAAQLRALGYERVRVYLGGKEEWVEHGLPVERAAPH